MTAAEKLRMEIAQEAPFSKDEFISKISRLIKAYGYASFICDKHIRETDVSPNGNTIRMVHEQIAKFAEEYGNCDFDGSYYDEIDAFIEEKLRTI